MNLRGKWMVTQMTSLDGHRSTNATYTIYDTSQCLCNY
jgi:hypothetical protein